jgi:hypothetical protein
MKLTNFRLVETKGKDCLTWEYIAEVDVITRGILFWIKRMNTKKIRRTYGNSWHFVDTGEWTPDRQAENLARAWTAQTGEPT